MKNTFSAYVRLSQTRTRESMQAAFRGFRAGLSGPCPGRLVGGTPNRPARREFVAVVLGRSYGFQRARRATRVLRIRRSCRPAPPDRQPARGDASAHCRAFALSGDRECVLVVSLA